MSKEQTDSLECQIDRLTDELATAKALLEASEQRFRDFADIAADWFWESDEELRFTYFSGRMLEVSGVDSDVLIGKSRRDLANDYADDPRWQAHLADLDAHRPFHDFRYEFLRPDGVGLHWSISGKPVLDAEGRFQGYRGTGTDVTEQRAVAKALQEQSALIRGIVGNVVNGIVTIDEQGIVESFNPSAERMFGYSAEQVIGQNVNMLMPESYKSQHDSYIQRYLSSGGGRIIGIGTREVVGLHSNGTIFPLDLSISEMHVDSKRLFIGVVVDITSRKQSEEKLSHQASHDDLTELLNRREFERRAEQLLSTAQLNKSEHALCFMDLDQFKIVNDTCGHIAGDELLRQIGRVLQDVLRKGDTLARLGGDEFGVLLEHCSLDKAEQIANTLRQSIYDFQFSWEGQPFRTGISIGLVAINETTPGLTELMKQVDAACFMAKDLGRNRIHTYHPEDIEIAERQGEMQWVSRITQALDKDRFCLYAQAIVPLGDSNDKHYELLLRMLDEQGNIIPPGAFLPAAERYDLIGQLDAWVIRNAIGLLKANPEFVKQIHFISINLSGPSMTNGDFLNSIITQLTESAIDASKICFEVTETAAISNLSAAITFITILKQAGCSFALDDFGSGLSSFGYLKKLPVDYLKIDGMFVKGIVDDPIDRAMVKSINDVGKLMGMQTIGEFVENDEIKQVLKDIGVTYGQGYGIEKPRPFVELLTLAKGDESQS